MKSTLFLHRHLHKQTRKTFFNGLTLKYPEFNALSVQNNTYFSLITLTLLFEET